VAVNGLPTPQDLPDRPDPFYGNSGGSSYGRQGNEVEKQGEGGNEDETSVQIDVGTTIDTSEKLENDDPHTIEDSGNGYDEVSEEIDSYADKDDSKCPGILDVCCKDPNFVAPPPKPQPYQASCGRRIQRDLAPEFLASKKASLKWENGLICALCSGKRRLLKKRPKDMKEER